MIHRLLPPNSISRRHSGWLRLAVHIICCVQLVRGFWLAWTDKIGGDPVESLIHLYGITSLQLLLLTLSVTPFVRFCRQPSLMRLRRPLGLYAAAFASSHLMIYIAYELNFHWGEVAREIVLRPYITVGFVAWLILMVLTVTSIPAMIRKLGKRWKPLHNAIYLVGILVCVHFIWSVKADISEPALYFAILAVLLFMRGDKLLRYVRKFNRKGRDLKVADR